MARKNKKTEIIDDVLNNIEEMDEGIVDDVSDEITNESKTAKKENIKPVNQLSFSNLSEAFVKERQKKGLTTFQISQQIKIGEKFILCIENNDIKDIPPVFLRGYIKKYAEILDIKEEFYLPYFDSSDFTNYTIKMKNYSQEDTKIRKKRKVFFWLIPVSIILVVVIGSYIYARASNTDNVKEVTQYISAPPPPQIIST